MKTNRNRIKILETKYKPMLEESPEIKALVNQIDFSKDILGQLEDIKNATGATQHTKDIIIETLEEFESLY